MKDKSGYTGKLYGIKTLPNTVRELVEAIYTDPAITQEEALDMADYLDKTLKEKN